MISRLSNTQVLPFQTGRKEKIPLPISVIFFWEKEMKNKHINALLKVILLPSRGLIFCFLWPLNSSKRQPFCYLNSILTFLCDYNKQNATLKHESCSTIFEIGISRCS
jgi:hypothetical protein